MTPIEVNALPPSPWKNGGGVTRTLAVSPPGATLDDFDWRISIADVTSSGDFSRFPGVDRTILLLDGPGMTLDLENGAAVPLTTLFEPYAFSGDDLVRSRLLNPSRDFNVMTRRGRARAEVQVWRAEAVQVPANLLFCPRGAYRIASGEILRAGWAILADRLSPDISFTPQTPDAVIISVLVKPI